MKQLTQIVEGCFQMEQKSQRLLYEHYYRYALKIAFRYIYRYDVAADIANDSFVKVFRNFGKFKYDEDANLEKALMGWIRRIVINTSIDELRRNKMVPEIGGIPDHAWNMADNSQFADQALIYKELVIQIKNLPPSYRAVFNMYVIDGFNHLEIAHHLGISVNTSKSNLSRARVLLQKFIKGLEEKEICNI